MSEIAIQIRNPKPEIRNKFECSNSKYCKWCLSRSSSHENMSANDAIQEATRNRIRPIFMSTLTSVVGMLPLVLFPGAGSELYRGLGSVVVGGLALSAILTLLIVPPMLSIVVAPLENRARRERDTTQKSEPVAGE